MKVIFVDDDINLGSFISHVLETDYNYSVHFQNTLIGIIQIINTYKPDIIILDVEIGNENSIKTAKKIIDNHPKLPILFVSSHTEEEMITKGIDVGGMAYLPKPLSISILISYIKRFTKNKPFQQSLKISDYNLDLETNNLFFKKNLLKKLSFFEKNALIILIQNPNKTVSKEQLAEKLWSHSPENKNTSSIQNIISRLRDILKENNSIKIDTVRGIGYVLRIL